MAIVGQTDVDATRQALVASIVQQVLEEKAKLLPLVTRYDAPAGAKSFGIPYRSSAAVASALSEDAEVSADAMSLVVDTMNLNLYPKRFDVSDVAKLQSSVDVSELVVQDISSSLARTIDDLILAELFNTANYASYDYNPTTEADHIRVVDPADLKGDILDARELLKNQGVPFEGEVHAVCSPAIEKLLLSEADFVRADAYGAREHIMNGEIGMLFGIRFHTHSGVKDQEVTTGNFGQMAIFHKEAIGVGIQQDISLEFFRDVKFLNDVYTGKMLAGCKMLGGGTKSVMFAEGQASN